jgi:hypothetical protein
MGEYLDVVSCVIPHAPHSTPHMLTEIHTGITSRLVFAKCDRGTWVFKQENDWSPEEVKSDTSGNVQSAWFDPVDPDSGMLWTTGSEVRQYGAGLPPESPTSTLPVEEVNGACYDSLRARVYFSSGKGLYAIASGGAATKSARKK